jgi:hypothetical protein
MPALQLKIPKIKSLPTTESLIYIINITQAEKPKPLCISFFPFRLELTFLLGFNIYQSNK